MGVYLEDLAYKGILPILARTGKLIDTRKIIEIDLVRCEECIYHDDGLCHRPKWSFAVEPTDFCSYGERRTEQGE